MELASKSQLRWAFVRAAAVFVPLLLMFAALVARVTSGDRAAWYAALSKPDWAPELSTYVLVWTLTLVLLGFATAIVWEALGNKLRVPGLLSILGILGLAFAWTPVVFGQKALGTGLIISLSLLMLSLAAVAMFFRMRPRAAWLTLPLVLWAGLLAATVYSLNARNPGGIPAGSPNEASGGQAIPLGLPPQQ
jgi:translocator protein